MGKFMKLRTVFAFFLAAVGMVSSAVATPITFTGSSGSLAASVSFDIVGGNLVVTLTNTSSADVLVPTDVLTAVFFNVSGNPTLSKISGLLAGGSTVIYNGQPAGGVIGGEWGYLNGISEYSDNSGISSTGLGVFGPTSVFPGPNLSGPADPDGLQYGLVSAGDNSATGNGGVTGSGGLIHNSVQFTLDNLPPGFNLAFIDRVTFQYGTALTDTSITGGCTNCVFQQTPEPQSLALVGFGLLALALMRRRKV
jgi:hypothetical protein